MARKPPSRKSGRFFNARAQTSTNADGPLQVKGNRIKIVRAFDYGAIGKVATDAGTAFDFSLTDLPNYAEFTALFDRFSIDKIELMFFFQNIPGTSTTTFPTLVHSIDVNDAITPLTENIVLERGNVKIDSFTQARNCIRMSFVPRTLAAGSGLAMSIQAPLGSLIDSLVPDTPYYGIKIWIQNYNTVTASNATVRMYAKYHMTFVTTK